MVSEELWNVDVGKLSETERTYSFLHKIKQELTNSYHKNIKESDIILLIFLDSWPV